MGSFLLIAALGGLWVHFASRWVRFGPPTWLSAFGTVALGNALASILILQFLVLPGLGPWGSFLLFALVSFLALALCIALVLRDAESRARPSLRATLGLAATTTAVTTLPGAILAVLPDVEAL